MKIGRRSKVYEKMYTIKLILIRLNLLLKALTPLKRSVNTSSYIKSRHSARTATILASLQFHRSLSTTYCCLFETVLTTIFSAALTPQTHLNPPFPRFSTAGFSKAAAALSTPPLHSI